MSLNEDFVEIDGRKVPTSKQLRKMGIITMGGSIITTKKKVSDGDYKLTSELVRSIVWNLMKYSSITFLQRLIEFLKIIERSYVKVISNLADVNTIDIENIKYFNEAIQKGKTGKELILTGYKVAGYKHLRGISAFQENFRGRKADEYSWEWLGASSGLGKKSSGLFLWIENAIRIGLFVTKGGKWIWPSDLTEERITYNPPDSFKYKNISSKMSAKTGEVIPVTGIWNPFDFKSGCPSFLLAGEKFPNTEIAVQKRENPEFVDILGVYQEGTVIYDYEERPSRWELLWEDNRYIDGIIPEEEKEYLDESCSFPTEPPEAVKRSP